MDDSEPRVKRQKIDKNGRFAALQKLRGLKGKKHKADVSEEIDNVYDIVDEKEFARRANHGNDWIEDDGTGYVEDGRDIFDDEDESSDDDKKAKNSKKKRSRHEEESVAKGKSSIRNLFSNAVPKKKKETVVKLAEDDALADILGEIDNENKPNNENSANINDKKVLNTKTEEVIVKEYMENFMKSIRSKEVVSTKKSVESDDEMLDSIMKPKKQENKTKPEILGNPILEQSTSLNQTDEKVENNRAQTNMGIEVKLIDFDKEDSNLSNQNLIPETEQDRNKIIDGTDYHALINDDEKDFVENIKELEINSLPSVNKDEQKIITPEEDMKNLLNNWENICQMDNFDEEINNVTNKEEDPKLSSEILKFWYWDAWEDSIKRPGDVFLFGKLHNGGENNFKSICIHVQNVERILYLLPREYLLDPITKEVTKQKVTLIDVYKEFDNDIAAILGISAFKSEKVTKNFAFHLSGIDVPETCEYIEIRYNGKKPAPNPKKKYNSIAYIFGTNTSFLETFLLERKIKGPGWLTLKNFCINEHPLSWCKIEATCSSPTNIELAEDQKANSPPPLIVMSINIRSVLNPKNNKSEIVMISCLVNNRFSADKPPPNPPFNRHFCGFTRPNTQNWPLDLQQNLAQYKSTKTTKLDSERALLSWFLATYQSIDPDLIVTHDAADLQLDLICDRIVSMKIPMWSRLGRLRMTQTLGKKMKDFFIGRLICDVKQSAEELIKSRSYDLNTLCQNVLKLKEDEWVDVSNDDLHRMYETSAGLLKLITLTMQVCSYILRLMCEMNVMPLALQITNVCGNLISRTLQGGRSERNEFLLLHAFHEKNYIVPDKKKKVWGEHQQVIVDGGDAANTTITRKKAAYSGGLVLDPIKGFYDKYILLMDFNSLYPSIIQEFNICFTTVPEPESANDVPPLPDSSVEQGILPRQIRRLVESRREVKKLMAIPDLDPDLKMQYNIRQLALKLTANSMYGCLGFAQSRFFAQHLASLVTAKGREILMETKNLVQKANYEVIYGDTDSIMVNTNSTDYDQVYKIGHNIKSMINKIYRQIELDIDGVFKSLLLLKKKKYAAVIVKKNQRGEMIYNQEHKGLDIVRRDWSQISVMAGKVVLNEILAEIPLEEKIENIHGHLEKFKQNILDGSVPLQLLTIAKQLTKPLKEYLSSNSFPHVTVAKRMNETRNKRYKKGDMVGYVICEDGTTNAAMQRAYHIEELKGNETLKIDTQYYLAQQIHPVVFRLCEPLEGTDASRIAQCLGLDPNKFRAAAIKAHREKIDEGGVGESIIKTNLQIYRQCEKFIFTCVSCNKQNMVASAFKPHEKGYISILQKCSNPECTAAPYQYIQSIRNEIILSIRSFIKRFYNNWMICDEPTCNVNTRIFSHVLINNRPICMTCKNGILIRSYSERDLYHQISYYQYIFDLNQYEQINITLPLEIETAYKTIRDTIDELLEKSAYCSINLNSIFGSMKLSEKSDFIPVESILF